MKLNIVII